MKIISFCRGYAAREDKLKAYIRIWESPDGYHPIEPNAKYDDEERIHHSVVFLYEGVLYPTGSKEDPNQLVGDVLLGKFMKVKIRQISTLRGRMWAAIAPYMIFIIIAVVIVAMILLGGPEIIKVIK